LRICSKISDYFSARAKTKAIIWPILSIVILFLVYAILTIYFPQSTSAISLDDPIFYTPEQIYNILESWGENQRTIELWFHLTWDFILPISMLFIFAIVISWLYQRAFNPESKYQNLNLIAFVIILDLLENIFLAILIINYPYQLIIIAWIKSIITITKYIAIIPIVLIILIGLIIAGKNKFKIQN